MMYRGHPDLFLDLFIVSNSCFESTILGLDLLLQLRSRHWNADRGREGEVREKRRKGILQNPTMRSRRLAGTLAWRERGRQIKGSCGIEPRGAADRLEGESREDERERRAKRLSWGRPRLAR